MALIARDIEILNMTTHDIVKRVNEIYALKERGHETDLGKKAVANMKNILSTREIKEMFTTLNGMEFISDLTYEGLAKIEEAAKILSENVTELKTQVELDEFFKKGYNLDIKQLKQQFKEKKLKDQFPGLDFEKIYELYVYPPRKLESYYDPKQKIQIDAFVWRKYMIAILQMIFNHMDFVVCNIGDEGAGKSCKCSQDMYIIWYIMTQIGLINYKFDISQMFANTLKKFSELEDEYYGVPFRIIALDEGNELNRQDWKEEEVKLFWQRLRRERHERRIKFINIPVLGEMIINIVLSRINFIFDMKNRNEEKTGTLYKGDYDCYIIPRGDKIFSPSTNRNLSKEEIKNKLYLNLKDKEYLKGLPTEIRIKKCHCNGVWAFREKDYVKEMKETNRQYSVVKGIKFGITELYAFYKANITLPKLGVTHHNIIYPSLKKMIYKIRGFWNNEPLLLAKYENIFKQKQEEKDQNAEPVRPRGRPKGFRPGSFKVQKTSSMVTADPL